MIDTFLFFFFFLLPSSTRKHLSFKFQQSLGGKKKKKDCCEFAVGRCEKWEKAQSEHMELLSPPRKSSHRKER